MLPFLTALLLTVLLHSILLGITALVIARRTDSPARRTWILRTAIVAPLLTAALQVSVGGGLGWNGWSVPSTEAPTAVDAGVRYQRARLDPAPLSSATDLASRAAHAPLPAGPSSANNGSPWRGWLLGLWGAGALGGSVLLLVQRRQFLRSLRRRSFDDTDAQRRLAGLTERSSIRLSASDALAVPLAVSSSEICLPRTRWNDLAGGQRDALLAHELAHVERRDPFWFLVENIIERALFVQPLVRILRRASRRAAELACDERAARATERPVELARCLATVAGWTHARMTPASMASMAHGDAPVVDRVERLLAFEDGENPEGSQRIFALGLLGAVAGFACVAPSVSPGDAEADLKFARHIPLATDTLLVAIEEDGVTTLSTGAGDVLIGTFDLDDDIEPFRVALARAASEFPRGGPGPVGDTLADGILRIRTTGDTPFYYAQLAMQTCGAVDVQIWNLELETSGTPDRIQPYRLPTDMGAAAVRPGRVELALRVADTEGAGRSLETRVSFRGGHPTAPVEEIEEEEPIEEIEEEPAEEIEEVAILDQPEEEIEEVSMEAAGDGDLAEIIEEVVAPQSTADSERQAVEERIQRHLDDSRAARGATERQSVEQRIQRYLDDRWTSDRTVAIDRVGYVLATTQAETVVITVRDGVTGREVAQWIDDVIGTGATHLLFTGVFHR